MLGLISYLIDMFSLNVVIVLLSAVPVTELRGSIPVAVALGVEPWQAFYLALIGNYLPVIPLALLLDPLVRLLKKVPYLDQIIEIILNRTRKQGAGVEKYGVIGLIIFVAIPSPFTGVWTGSVLAYLLGIRILYVLLSMAVAITIAGLLVTFATMGVIELALLFSPAASIVVIIIIIIFLYLLRKRLLGN